MPCALRQFVLSNINLNALSLLWRGRTRAELEQPTPKRENAMGNEFCLIDCRN